MTTEDRQRADMYPVLMSLLREWYTTSDAQGDPEHDTALAEDTRWVLKYDTPQTAEHCVRMYPKLVRALRSALYIWDQCYEDGDEMEAGEVYQEIQALLDQCGDVQP